MSPDDDIFADALELPAAERAAFLDRACTDAAQRERVDRLLTGHDAAADFLQRSPAPRSALPPEEQPGDMIGHYRLLRRIGEGGCGVVYLAEQTEPVRRHVALKVIKLGMDTREVIARFEVERQALAMMDHPDIARVFDAGATKTGRPFFVMEFVDGVPFTRFCDEHNLAMSERLELFARVCLALQHAHQKGIIHRDLKPSNILVALHEGVASPKIIDFGIAKATQGRLGEHTLHTQFEQFVGTPAYMSPEQAEWRDLDIDTRSDVYSLGVLLYEVLTGQPPFDPQSLVRAGVDEIRRIIREVDPPRPSTRLSTLTDADRTTVARQRRVAPVQLSSSFRGDLDWIVMRCLEKQRDRRYATAAELADDVRRHLRQEPISARPPSAAYRTGRFVARHRVACVSAAAVAAALILGTVVSVRQAVRATRAERVARTERDVAEAATRAEALARSDAQRRQEQAEDLLTFMLGDFRTGLQAIGRLELLDAVGGKAMDYFAALDPRDQTDTALTRHATAFTQIGEVRMDQARYDEAFVAFSAAYERAAALVDRYPDNADMLFERAQAEYWIGFVARRRGDTATQRDWLVRYRDSALALAALEGDTPRAQQEVIFGHHNFAVLEFEEGSLANARTEFLAEQSEIEQMLARDAEDTTSKANWLDTVSWLGSIADRDGDYDLAQNYFQEMDDRAETFVAEAPEVVRWQFYAAESATFIGHIEAQLGNSSAALAAYAQARARLDPLVEGDPMNRRWQIAQLNIELHQIPLWFIAGDVTAAESQLGSACERLEALVAAEPTSLSFVRRLARAWRLTAALQFVAGDADSTDAMARALAFSDTLATAAETDHHAASEFGQMELLAGRIALAVGRAPEAQLHWNRVLDVLGARAVDSRDWHVLDPVAQARALLDQPTEAAPLLGRLREFGYHTTDPVAAAIRPAIFLPLGSTQP